MKSKQVYALAIFQAETRHDGRIKPAARLHIVRVMVGKEGAFSVAACGQQGAPKYVFPFKFLDWHERSGLVCVTCAILYREKMQAEKNERAHLRQPATLTTGEL